MWSFQKFELIQSAIEATTEVFKSLNGKTLGAIAIGFTIGWFVRSAMIKKEEKNNEAVD